MKKAIVQLSLLLLPVILSAQTVLQFDNFNMTAIDNAITGEMNQSGLPSVSLGIIYGGRIVYTKAYGVSLPGQNVTTATKYPIASISKTITGVMAMRMVQNGDIALDTPIRRYVGGFTGSAITIRHLLSHQSGIGHYDDCPAGYNGQFNAASSLLTVLGCSRCMTPPGAGTIYTTYGTTLLGVIIDIVGRDVYNKGFIQLYNEWIRDAAGLTDLTAEYNNSVSGMAFGYSSGGAPQIGSWSDIGWKLPAGGFVSNAHDLAGFGVGVMNFSFINSTRSNQMWTQQTTTGGFTNNCSDDTESPYGLAFRVSGSGDNLLISHSGLNDHGYSSLIHLYPRQQAGIVLLTNRYLQTGALGDIMNAITTNVLCPDTREFTSLINWSGNRVFESSNIINSTNGYTTSAANGSIVLDAATEVILKPGFYATSGTNFRAMIEGCGGSVKPY